MAQFGMWAFGPWFSDLEGCHSAMEKRYPAIGHTSRGRLLFVAFTIRRKLIRVISVRDMNRREVEEYKRHEKGS